MLVLVCGLSVRMKSLLFFVSPLVNIQVHLLLGFFLKCVHDPQVSFPEVTKGVSSFVFCSVSEGTGAGLPNCARPDFGIEVPHFVLVVGLAAGVEAVNILIHHADSLISVVSCWEMCLNHIELIPAIDLNGQLCHSGMPLKSMPLLVMSLWITKASLLWWVSPPF